MYNWSYFAPDSDSSKNAAIAMRFDSQGFKAEAIKYYQKACNDLLELASIYRGNYPVVKVWIERHNAYQNRIKILKMQLQGV